MNWMRSRVALAATTALVCCGLTLLGTPETTHKAQAKPLALFVGLRLFATGDWVSEYDLAWTPAIGWSSWIPVSCCRANDRTCNFSVRDKNGNDVPETGYGGQGDDATQIVTSNGTFGPFPRPQGNADFYTVAWTGKCQVVINNQPVEDDHFIYAEFRLTVD
jgi:hypothetical protein